jgi:hypothetical protein
MITMKTMLTINHVDVVDSCIHDKEGDKDESSYNRGNQVFSHYHTRKSKKTVVLLQVDSSFCPLLLCLFWWCWCLPMMRKHHVEGGFVLVKIKIENGEIRSKKKISNFNRGC